MQLKKIKISNYRNFRDYSIDFGVETTIFIGKNGTGKTNLISAIAHSLSFIFSKKKDEIQYEFIASSDENVKSFDSTDARFDYEKQDYSYPLSIQIIAQEDIDAIQWEFKKEGDTTGLKDTLYSKANKQFWNNHISNNEISELPIFAFFHDSYPHVTASIKGTKIEEKLDSGNPMPRNTAYFKWNDERNCTEIWERHFTMQLTNYKLENRKGNKDYLDAINQKMIDFSQTIFKLTNADEVKIEKLEIEKRGKDYVLIVVYKNGNHTPFSQLPQGYKRILSIVFDIANRAYLLNSNSNPSGVVIIDEIELHLHPSIAQEILNALKQTYPNIQFIVSTHSPLVITNFKQDDKNFIYKLYSENGNYQNERIENIYGLDYNSGLREWMDAPYRQFRVEELKKAYEYWKNAGNTDKQLILKNKIKEEVGENSQIYKSLN
jgi:predicted ATP-binding protein involved in virulence